MVAFILVSVPHCALLSPPPPLSSDLPYITLLLLPPHPPPPPPALPPPPLIIGQARRARREAEATASARARCMFAPQPRGHLGPPRGPIHPLAATPDAVGLLVRKARRGYEEVASASGGARAKGRAPRRLPSGKFVLKSRSTAQCDHARGGRAERYYWCGWRGRASARLPAATTRQQLKLVPQSHGVVVVAAQAARPRGARRSCWYGMRRGGRAQTTARAAGGAVGVSAHARGAWLRGAAPGTGARGRRCARRRLRPRALFAPPPLPGSFETAAPEI